MRGNRISELNSGLAVYRDELMADGLAKKRVEVSIITFGGEVTTTVDFTTAEQFQPPQLTASGDTPMGAAIHRAIDAINERKQIYRTNGIMFYRPWIFMITDGGPTDEWRSAAERVKQGEASKGFSFFAIGVEDADVDTLQKISVREPLNLSGLQFQ
jgi:uncharacterized protein YegL